MDNKQFDLHFEVGSENGLYYARNVVGGNSFEFKQLHPSSIGDVLTMVVSELSANGIFNSLAKQPSFSDYPIPMPNHYPSGTRQYFEFHVECGKVDSHDYYARNAVNFLSGNGVRTIRRQETFIDDAICTLIMDVEAQGLFVDMSRNPMMSVYPFPSASSTPATGGGSSSVCPSNGSVSSSTTTTPKKKDVELRRPSDIGNEIAHPACQDVCMSFEHFLDKKCHSICEWRFK